MTASAASQTEPTAPLILSDSSNGIGVLTLNSPQRRNCLCKELMDCLRAALDNLQQNGVRVVILRAQAGAKVFSSGHDVHELPTNGRDPLGYNDPLRSLVRAVEHFPAPIIAMVEGSVWGGACELVMACDIIIAADDSTFAITPAKLGVPYNVSGVQNLLNSGGMPLCKEMLFTAQPFPVKRLVEQGVVSHAVPHGEIESFTRNLAEQIARNSPLVIRLLKEELRLLSNAHSLSPETFERVQAMRRESYDSYDYREGIQAFLEKRAPLFQGK